MCQQKWMCSSSNSPTTCYAATVFPITTPHSHSHTWRSIILQKPHNPEFLFVTEITNTLTRNWNKYWIITLVQLLFSKSQDNACQTSCKTNSWRNYTTAWIPLNTIALFSWHFSIQTCRTLTRKSLLPYSIQGLGFLKVG